MLSSFTINNKEEIFKNFDLIKTVKYCLFKLLIIKENNN